ncbi:MAG: hypothetical protein DHS20C12_12010 [Pseudohongiella sp.]|nr:MAG: hypothetical protein DHS20C12_12010 [Pseudohongiella sp.]
MALNNGNFRIMYRNLIDVATLTSTPAPGNVASMPIDNVKTLNHMESFRSTTTDSSGITITGSLTQAERVSGVVLNRHNLKAGDTWRFRGWSGAGQTGTEYDSGWLNALMFKKLGELDTKVDKLVTTVFDEEGWETQFSRMFFGSIVVRSFTIEIISDGNSDGYIDINRIWLARAVSFQRNFGYDYELDWIDTSLSELTEGNSPRFERGGSFRQITLAIPRIFDTDRHAASDLIRHALSSNEVFIDLFPEKEGKLERDYTMTAYIADRSALRTINANKHTIRITFRET